MSPPALYLFDAEQREQGTAFEGYTLIAVAAGMTTRLRLGHLVLGNPYRNPGLLAKMAATLDQASEGDSPCRSAPAGSTASTSPTGGANSRR